MISFSFELPTGSFIIKRKPRLLIKYNKWYIGGIGSKHLLMFNADSETVKIFTQHKDDQFAFYNVM